MWAAPALAVALLTSLNPILYKGLLARARPVEVVWSVVGGALPILAVVTIAWTPVWPAVNASFFLAVGASAVLNALAHLALARALAVADVSLVTPMLSFSPVFTLLLSAVTLGEVPSPRGLAGVALVLLGAYGLNGGLSARWSSPLRALAASPAVRLVMLAGLLWAVTPVMEKLAIQHTAPPSPRVTALAANGLLVVVLTPFALRTGRSALTVFARRREWLLAAGIAGVAPALGYTAVNLGPVGYVTTLFRLSALFSVIWGAWLLREPGLRRRLPSSAMMVAGAVLIAM